jgi:hypothetical protein
MKYDGGSVGDMKVGTDLKLFLSSENIRFVKSKETVLTIPSSSITEISYGQDVHRRVAALFGDASYDFSGLRLGILPRVHHGRTPGLHPIARIAVSA